MWVLDPLLSAAAVDGEVRRDVLDEWFDVLCVLCPVLLEPTDQCTTWTCFVGVQCAWLSVDGNRCMEKSHTGCLLSWILGTPLSPKSFFFFFEKEKLWSLLRTAGVNNAAMFWTSVLCIVP